MLYRINSLALARELRLVGVSEPGMEIMLKKASIDALKVLKVRIPAANIIKQEMLATGGDCAVSAATILGSGEYEDVILLGQEKHYRTLLYKLKNMSYFGLAGIAEDLEKYLADLSSPKTTLLRDGRIITYDKMAVMGIINLTPDSFYEGSRRQGQDAVLAQAEAMLAHGADILDFGGESTRPGSDSVSAEEERRRVLPAVKAVKERFPESIISVDTYRAALAEECLDAGADIINDISAGEGDPEMFPLVVKSGAPIILMHKKGLPKNMQEQCEYGDVVKEVTEYLFERAELLAAQGVGADKIVLDPGIGFAKNDRQNMELMQNIDSLAGSQYPVLMAASRKSTIGRVLGDIPAEERLEGTLAVTASALYGGADMVRVHDVLSNVRFIRMLEAIRNV